MLIWRRRIELTVDGSFPGRRHGATAMRLMITVFVLVLLVIIDQSQFNGHYTMQLARFLRYAFSLVGL
jgi:hypothetical protein